MSNYKFTSAQGIAFDTNGKGIGLPQIDNINNATTIGIPAGSIVYAVAQNGIYFFNGTAWISGQGTSGTSGSNGTSGSTGSSGSSGSSGSTGSSGSSGTTGTSGSSGSSGTTGTAGSSGSSGESGSSGSTGSSGSSGTSGLTGTSGTSGTSGHSGSSGSSGVSFIFKGTYSSDTTYNTNDVVVYNGSAYTSLLNGNIGNQPDTSLSQWSLIAQGGTSGTSGASGAQGANGTSGASGAQGANGTAGTSGISTANARAANSYTATAGQTTFAITYTVGQVDVFVNGFRLSDADFTATNGTSVILGTALTLGDIVDIIAYTTGGGIAYSGLSASTPLTYNPQTGAFAIPQAGNGTSGFLSSSDWASFSAKNATGAQGPAGTAGSSGSSGSSGSAGTSGANGSSGSSGSTGSSGSSGSTGTSGSSGSSGTSGSSGSSGSTGSSGTSGAGTISGGTSGYVAKFTGSTTLASSQITDNGSSVSINNASPYSSARFQVKTATDINLAVQTGTADSSGIKLNAFNDIGTTNVPMELNASYLRLKTGETTRLSIDGSGNSTLTGNSTVGGYYTFSSWTTGTINKIRGYSGNDDKSIQWNYDNSPAGTVIKDNNSLLISINAANTISATTTGVSIAGNLTVNNAGNTYIYGQTTNSFVRLDNSIGAQISYVNYANAIYDNEGAKIFTANNTTPVKRFQVDVSGDVTISTGNLIFGKSADPRIYAGTGIGFNIDGEALYLNRYSSSNMSLVYGGGSVIIGNSTLTPSYTLHVKKNANQVAGFESPNANTWIDLVSTSGNWSLGASSTDTSSFGVYQRVGSGSAVNKEYLNVNSSGFLGVNLQGGSAGFQITAPDYDGYEAVTMLGSAQPTIRFAGSDRFNITTSGFYCGLRTQSSRWRYMRMEADIKSSNADHYGFFWSSDKASSLGIGDSNAGYKWVFQPSSNTINIRDINSNGDLAVSSTVPFDEKDGNWHHYVTELSHDGRVRIWVDGVLYHNRYGYNPGFGYCGISNYTGTIEVANFSITSSETVVQDVAFFAYHNASDVNYVNTTLPYQNELYDYGGGYNPNGTYTAPVAGMYMFSATCNANASGSYPNTVPRAYWQINGADIGYSVHFRGNDLAGGASSGLTQRAATVVLYLNYGDTVRIQVKDGQFDLFGANHFCGYLLK